jgi:hypothetical protein
MAATMTAERRLIFGFAVGVIALLTMESGRAQSQPSDIPTNLLSRAVPYEQGMATIEAQGAARPQATQPLRPGELAGAPDPLSVSPTNAPRPSGGSDADPRPR